MQQRRDHVAGQDRPPPPNPPAKAPARRTEQAHLPAAAEVRRRPATAVVAQVRASRVREHLVALDGRRPVQRAARRREVAHVPVQLAAQAVERAVRRRIEHVRHHVPAGRLVLPRAQQLDQLGLERLVRPAGLDDPVGLAALEVHLQQQVARHVGPRAGPVDPRSPVEALRPGDVAVTGQEAVHPRAAPAGHQAVVRDHHQRRVRPQAVQDDPHHLVRDAQQHAVQPFVALGRRRIVQRRHRVDPLQEEVVELVEGVPLREDGLVAEVVDQGGRRPRLPDALIAELVAEAVVVEPAHHQPRDRQLVRVAPETPAKAPPHLVVGSVLLPRVYVAHVQQKLPAARAPLHHAQPELAHDGRAGQPGRPPRLQDGGVPLERPGQVRRPLAQADDVPLVARGDDGGVLAAPRAQIQHHLVPAAVTRRAGLHAEPHRPAGAEALDGCVAIRRRQRNRLVLSPAVRPNRLQPARHERAAPGDRPRRGTLHRAPVVADGQVQRLGLSTLKG